MYNQVEDGNGRASMSIAVELELADDVARSAESEGLLTPEALAELVRAELKRRKPAALAEPQELRSGLGEAKSTEEGPLSENTAEAITLESRMTPTMKLLQSWIDAAPTDPEEIRIAEEELREFKRNMNAPRKEAGARLLYPDVE
jgi:hypothetical protein